MLVRRLLLPVVLLAAAACGTEEYSNPPPVDRFVYPTGLALHRLPSGTNALLVVSSNVDLLYEPDAGGTVISLDPTADPPRWLGAVTIPSFGGPIVVADEESCPGVGVPRAFVASRYAASLLMPEIGTGGELTCGTGCARALADGVEDPFGVAVACRGERRRAYVGYLAGLQNAGVLTELDLESGAQSDITGLPGIPYGIDYDAERDRLWLGQYGLGLASVTALELGVPCLPEEETCPRKTPTYDLWSVVRGAEPTGIALSNPQPGLGRRLYVAARVYDPDVASAAGARPGYDVGAVLFVIDVEDGPTGHPPSPIPVVRVVPLGLGARQIRVLPVRPGMRDLVAVTSTTEGLVTLYDDEVGAIAKVLAAAQEPSGPENPAGAPLGPPRVGTQPFGLAVEARDGMDWIYVASFTSGTVTAISLDPSSPSDAVIVWSIAGVAP
ncbi:MAG TPA: hypothetical protein VLS93_07120 [Anaeromyxobacteraceae bacterium]|nr:hypothetical protein [Anaeromyxobacteraceae bacterium]